MKSKQQERIRIKAGALVTLMLLRNHAEMGGPPHELPGDKRNFSKQQKMLCPCGVLGCCELCSQSVCGRAVEFYTKNCNAKFRMLLYSLTAVKGRSMQGWNMQRHTSSLMVGDLNCTGRIQMQFPGTKHALQGFWNVI